MERKKIAVLLPWLKMGGTNKVAIRFMEELVQFYDVTLVLSQNTGELLGEIPKGVHTVIDEITPFSAMFKKDVQQFRIINVVRDIIYYLRVKTGRDSIDNYLYVIKRHSYILDDVFDCAISYHGQSPERLLNLIYRIHSKKKVVWIHGEMSFSKDQCKRMEKYYRRMDHFFFVSNQTKESFFQKVHIDLSKTTIYYNPLKSQEIIEKSREEMDEKFDRESINLLTVGRVSAEKGQDMIPGIVRNLNNKGYQVRWYIIGDGPNMGKLKDLIKKENVDNKVILLGVKNNPYPYMKACDIYIQPSYTEGYSTTICEAGVLGKAIIGTKPSGGIRDQIVNGENGLIVNASIEGLEQGIVKLLRDPVLIKKFEQNILKKDFEGKGEIKKFINYIEDK